MCKHSCSILHHRLSADFMKVSYWRLVYIHLSMDNRVFSIESRCARVYTHLKLHLSPRPLSLWVSGEGHDKILRPNVSLRNDRSPVLDLELVRRDGVLARQVGAGAERYADRQKNLAAISLGGPCEGSVFTLRIGNGREHIRPLQLELTVA